MVGTSTQKSVRTLLGTEAQLSRYMPICTNLGLVHELSFRWGYGGAYLSLAVPVYRLNPPSALRYVHDV